MSAVSAKTPEPSMDEILASIRRIIADDGEGAVVSGAASGDDRPAGLDEVHRSHPAAVAPAADIGSPLPEIGFSEPPAAPAPAAAAPRPEPSIAGWLASDRPDVATLVSREATESIGQAFNALSHTILSQNARTLEDLVKDMLRPMLKAWLDDNLPPLVERLVRAEIERVARGSR